MFRPSDVRSSGYNGWMRQLPRSTVFAALAVGLLQGANSEALDAVASMDHAGTSTLFRCDPMGYAVDNLSRAVSEWRLDHVDLVAGVSWRTLGMVNFDAEISAEGETLFSSTASLPADPPASADLVIGRRRGVKFERRATVANCYVRSTRSPSSTLRQRPWTVWSSSSPGWTPQTEIHS